MNFGNGPARNRRAPSPDDSLKAARGLRRQLDLNRNRPLLAQALVRFERGAPSRCPTCESYRVVSDFRPEIGDAGGYVTLCANCGWEDESSEGE
jgi:hypothetical protein